MCGVAGIVGDASAETLLPAAQKMAAAMRHRGPDSCGVSSSAGCLLVNTRLAIVDLSDRGRQPMSNPEQTVWISYNGETYNAAELRQELTDKGYCFYSRTDTEVILRLYEEYGEGCVQRMRGMFAFAIWDARARKLLLARDRLGIKPLYFVRQAERLIFASELKSLLASGLIDRRINGHAIRLYLQLGHVPQPWTIVDGVLPFPPGHVGTWQNGTLSLTSYWDFDRCRDVSKPASSADWGEQLGDVLFESVQKHLISDVPIALFLSGGTDSACLGALAQSAGCANVTAISVGFSEHEFDETALSRETARALRLAWKPILLSPDRVAAEIDRCIWAIDQPSVDGVNCYWTSKIAAEQGFKVALSGQGGDELFGGYDSWKWFTRLETVAAWTGLVPRFCSRLFDHEEWPYRWRKLSYLFSDGDAFLASQLAVRILFLESDLPRFLTPAFDENGAADARKYLKTCAAHFHRSGQRKMLGLMDICAHLQPRLLRDLDAMSMAHSLEVRPVFLDDQVLAFALSLPGFALRRPKELLLQSMRRFMPDDLFASLKARAKRTFTFPFATWLARELKPAIEETFSPARLNAGGILQADPVGRLWKRFQTSPESVGWSRIWSLFVLARWCEAMDVRP